MYKIHKENCQCPFCKAKRGELKGNNCPNFGRKGNKAGRYIDGRSSKIYYCIEKDCNNIISGKNRRCGHHAKIERFKSPKEKEKLKGKTPWNKLPREKRICNCGCGEEFECKVKSNRKFINHHHSKLENNANWIDGSSFKPYPLGWNKTFKEQIRFRDGYRCQLCGVPEIECKRKLDVHHIDYDKMNIKPNNLISLCNSCHVKTNYNRDYWQEYFIKIMENKYA